MSPLNLNLTPSAQPEPHPHCRPLPEPVTIFFFGAALVAYQVLYFDIVLHASMADPCGFGFGYNHHPIAAIEFHHVMTSDSDLSSMIDLNHNKGDVNGTSSRIFYLDLNHPPSQEITWSEMDYEISLKFFLEVDKSLFFSERGTTVLC